MTYVSNVGTIYFYGMPSQASQVVLYSGRILSQLFVEALLLTTIGAAVGLVISRIALDRVEVMAGAVPFWWDYSLGLSTILYALGLAVIAGLIPDGTSRGGNDGRKSARLVDRGRYCRRSGLRKRSLSGLLRFFPLRRSVS